MASPQVLLEYLTTTKIGEKGQLTVPKQFREDLGLATGAPFAVLRLGDGLILLPEQSRFDRLCERVSAALTGAGITQEAVLATLPETRQRIFARRYGATGSAASPSRSQTHEHRKK
jgi:AbrB family looped-hinge helix DNA binding protein